MQTDNSYPEFIIKLKQEINNGLPGWDAQKKMAPPGRKDIRYNAEGNENSRESAVLLWLYPTENKIFTRLILRTEGGVHSGQVAFPGGQVEKNDNGFWNTALREANEEVGILPGAVAFVGALTPLYIPPSNFWVHPFIGAGESIVSGKISEAEVKTYFDIAILQLLQPGVKKDTAIALSSKGQMIAPSYILDGHIVWGATAMILSELEALIRRALKDAPNP